MKKNKALDSDAIFEKKKWISITGLCNNNCLFCLDKGRPDTYHRPKKEVMQEIKAARDEGCTKLILSGGDPTIHPDIVELVAFGKSLGFSKVQVITNGRMFASERFTIDMIRAGLDEVTFSIHGHNQTVHDLHTSVTGSFRQVMKGVKNVQKHDVIINTDTCITKINYRMLPEIIRFIVEVVGITEVNLMNMVPEGNAWKYRNMILYDPKLVAPYIKKVIDYCIARDVVLWLSRVPPEVLEGYEEFIEDPYKLVDEVRGRLPMLKDTVRPKCKGEKCRFCNISRICHDLLRLNMDRSQEKAYDEIVELNQDNLKGNVRDNALLVYPEPTKRLQDYDPPKISKVIKYLKMNDRDGVYVKGIPPCILMRNGIRNIRTVKETVDYEKYHENKDFLGLAQELACKSKMKRLSCDECILKDGCEGIYINYVRRFGPQEFVPVKSREIRINLECNQNCIFCNTDEGADGIVTDREAVLEEIDKMAKEGVNYLIISGKEPTLCKHLEEYISYAKTKGLFKIELQTNAVMCSDSAYAKEIRNKGLTHAFISLHAADEEMSAKITRAPQTFDKTVSGINNLKALGVEITINIVINRFNKGSMSEIVRFISSEFGRPNIVFSYMSPVAEALKNLDALPKISDVLPDLFSAFERCLAYGINFRMAARCGIPLCMLGDYKVYHDEHIERRFLDTDDKKKPDCIDCIYHDHCSGLWNEYIKVYGTSEIKPVLPMTDVEINIGKACNNRCRFCMSNGPDKVMKFAQYHDLKKDVINAASEGYSQISILGGEPTIYPNIIPLVRLMRKNGFNNIRIISNGRRLSEPLFLRKLVRSGVNNFSISMHGHDRQVCDYLAGVKGCFDEQDKALDNFMEIADLIRPPSINLVLNKLNYINLHLILDYFQSKGIKEVRLNSMMSDSGYAAINVRELLPRFSDIIPYVERVMEIEGVSLSDFPLCVFSGMFDIQHIMQKIGECKLDKNTNNISYNIEGEIHSKKEFIWRKRRINEMKQYVSSCNRCRLKYACEGVWIDYIKLYGESEFLPL